MVTNIKFPQVHGCDRGEDQEIEEILAMMRRGERFEGPASELYTHHQIPEVTGANEITVHLRPLKPGQAVYTGPFRYAA